MDIFSLFIEAVCLLLFLAVFLLLLAVVAVFGVGLVRFVAGRVHIMFQNIENKLDGH